MSHYKVAFKPRDNELLNILMQSLFLRRFITTIGHLEDPWKMTHERMAGGTRSSVILPRCASDCAPIETIKDFDDPYILQRTTYVSINVYQCALGSLPICRKHPEASMGPCGALPKELVVNRCKKASINAAENASQGVEESNQTGSGISSRRPARLKGCNLDALVALHAGGDLQGSG